MKKKYYCTIKPVIHNLKRYSFNHIVYLNDFFVKKMLNKMLKSKGQKKPTLLEWENCYEKEKVVRLSSNGTNILIFY